MRASEIAEFLGSELVGKDIEIVGVCSLDNLKPCCLAFCKFDRMPWTPYASTILFLVCLEYEYLSNIGLLTNSYISVPNPRYAHARVTEKFFQRQSRTIPSGDGRLAPHRYLEVTILDCNVTWGEDCYFKPGAVIGGSGFGWENDSDGVPIRRPHIGGVKIGNNVEVGANSTIDRGTIDDTIIEDNVKIDNLVHVAHNCRIGENTCIVAGSVICGSVTIGRNCWVGAGAIIKNQVTIGDNVTIGVGAIVVKDVPSGSVLAGIKAQPIERMRHLAVSMENDGTI